MEVKKAATPHEPPDMRGLENANATTIEDLTRSILALAPKGPLEMSGLSLERQRALTEVPKPQRWRLVACKSEETEATFLACVVESKKMPGGRITQIHDYKHPCGVYAFVEVGGLVPDGFPMLRGDWKVSGEINDRTDPTAFSPAYLAWRWENYFKRDLQRYIGKELKPFMCADAVKGMATPWQEGTVGIRERE
jgi:hypothetical protein